MSKEKRRANRDKLTQRIVEDYEPAHFYYAGQAYFSWRRRPPFWREIHVPAMMEDSRLQFGMLILKGMITSLSRFFVDLGDAEEGQRNYEIKEFLKKQIDRFWLNSANKMLMSMDWGFAGAEVLYRLDEEGRYCFDDMNYFDAPDIHPLVYKGEYVGLEVQHQGGKKVVGGQKSFWTVHKRHINRWWGSSRYKGAYEPWLEMHDEGGARDLRRLYYYKHVIQGQVMYYPPGRRPPRQGQTEGKPNSEVARALLEKSRAGGVFILPHEVDEHGNRKWEVVDRKSPDSAEDIREWVDDVKQEITEGIGLSQEVIEAAETGSGYSGRKVPEQAVRGMLTDVVYFLMNDYKTQVLVPLVRRNFDVEPDFEVRPFGLVEEDEEGGDLQAIAGRPGDQIKGVPDKAVSQAKQLKQNGSSRVSV